MIRNRLNSNGTRTGALDNVSRDCDRESGSAFPTACRYAVKKASLVIVFVFALASSPSPAAAQIAQSSGPTTRLEESLELDSAGNGKTELKIVLPASVYQLFMGVLSKQEVQQVNGQRVVATRPPSVGSFLKYIGLTTSAQLVENLTGEFDDTRTTVTARYTVPGRASVREGRWELGAIVGGQVPIEVRSTTVDGLLATAELAANVQGTSFSIVQRVKLPEGASGARFDRATGMLTYRAAPRLPADAGSGTAHPTIQLDAKPELMSALYKLYGNPDWNEFWAARAVIRNTTVGVLTDFRLRFRIEGFASWSPWSKADAIYPGQTLVNPYFPVFSAGITRLQGTTPAMLEVEYEYLANGKKVSDTEAARIRLLGLNEAVWNSYALDGDSTWYEIFRNAAPIVASFVTADDPVIQDVLGAVARATHGTGTSLSDESALAFAGTLYDLFRENIAYETSSGQVDSAVRQHLKFGRDVLRTRSGTCINLAILFASVLEATNLESSIVLVPEHAFVKMVLPVSKRPVFIETTLCGGGTKESSRGFVESQVVAMIRYQRELAAGKLLEINVPALRRQGVRAPELPDVGTHPLQDWGIKQPEMAKTRVVPTLLATAKLTLEEMKVNAVFVPDETALVFQNPHEKPWIVEIRTDETTGFLKMTSIVKTPVPADFRPKLLELCNQWNSQICGCFRLPEPDAIALATSFDARASSLTAQSVAKMLADHGRIVPQVLALIAQAQAQEQPRASNQTPAHVTFVNTTGKRLTAIWINDEKQEVAYGVYEPGQEWGQDTFIGHRWLFRDTATNAAVAEYTVARDEKVLIKG